jgi:hypothetical protein
MSLRPGETPGNGVAVFPFLKTSGAVALGSFTFRSTDDVNGLTAEDSAHVREIAEMLYLQDDLRILSASYAILPAISLDAPGQCLSELEHLQAIVAYCYSAPHPTLGNPFHNFEHVSMAVFSPQPVSIFLVRPEHHVQQLSPGPALTPDRWHNVPGYYGRYNFRQPFWVAKGSRLYPPVPHIGLNISQDLSHDLASFFGEAPQHQLLPELLLQPMTATKDRVLTAIIWYNRANALTRDKNEAIMHLAVAFETLLALPKDAKTDRFTDSVSLLLGRIERLDLWAEQFYDARSMIAHGGRAEQVRFVPPGGKNSEEGPFYRSLLDDGRQIFQLCVGTLLFGADLGVWARLQEKLETNLERFQFICKILDDNSLAMSDRFASIAATVESINRYQFVPETGLLIEPMVGAVQRAAKCLLSCDDSLEMIFKQRVENLANAPRSRDSYEVLGALEVLRDEKIVAPVDPRAPVAIFRRLAEVVWGYVFMHYFWLKEQRRKVDNKSEAI